MRWRDVPFKRRFPWWIWRFEFKRQALWIGVYWARSADRTRTDVWVCLVPMLPFHLRIDEPPFF